MAALVPCKVCKKEVARNAKICPHCGIKDPGVNMWAGVGCLVIIILAVVVYTSIDTAVQDAKPLTVAEQRALQLKQGFNFDGSHIMLTQLIKMNMKNPDSYQHIRTDYVDKGDYLLVETEYRGTNSFNAVVPGKIKAKTAINGDLLEILP